MPDGIPPEGGCPPGLPGIPGWASNEDVIGKSVPVHSRTIDKGQILSSRVDEFLYVDKTNKEFGLRLSGGGRVFVKLDDAIDLIMKAIF